MVVVTYALAVVRLAGKGVLIQRINAVKSVSPVDLLFMDKTGTITTNNLRLETLLPVRIGEDEIHEALGDFVTNALSGNRTTSAIAASCG